MASVDRSCFAILCCTSCSAAAESPGACRSRIFSSSYSRSLSENTSFRRSEMSYRDHRCGEQEQQETCGGVEEQRRKKTWKSVTAKSIPPPGRGRCGRLMKAQYRALCAAAELKSCHSCSQTQMEVSNPERAGSEGEGEHR